MSTVQPGREFEAIVRDCIRDGLRSAQDDPSYIFSDAGDRDRPAVPDNDGPSALVVTSFPSRAVTYPHVVVKEKGDSAERPDSRTNLWRHNYSVTFECHGRSATEVGKLIGGARAWVQNNIPTIRDAGLHDVSIGDPRDIQHFEDVRTNVKAFSISGTLYTA